MTSREQALRTILGSISPLETIDCPLEKSLGHLLEEDIYAGTSVPDVDRSAMDGYAIRSHDTSNATVDTPVRLKIVGEIHPSTDILPTIKQGEAIAILTGGAMPPGADAVVRQEQVETHGDTIVLKFLASPHQYVTQKGKDIDKGSRIAKRGTVITPVLFSVLASLRTKTVPTRKKTTVCVLAIGNELVNLHDEQNGGKIVASNLFLLSALLESLGARIAFARITENNESAIRKDLEKGLKSDLIITTGGTGKGRCDLTGVVLKKMDIDLKCAGISMAPGKGTLFGMLQDKPVFALPGTPAAVLAVFHTLIRPAIGKLMGNKTRAAAPVIATLEEDIHRKPGLERLVQGLVAEADGKLQVRPLVGPGKKGFLAMTGANGFVIIPPDKVLLKKGQPVSVLITDDVPSTAPIVISQQQKLGDKNVPCVSIVGKSDAGKTTLLEKLIPELRHRGYKVGSIKHDVHGFSIDHEGKDSWRHKQAGASTVIISSPSQIAMVQDVRAEASLPGLVTKYFQDRDIVLTEGFKREKMPKVEIFRKSVHAEPLCEGDENLVALVSDTALDLGVPYFPLDDVKGLADFLEKTFLKK